MFCTPFTATNIACLRKRSIFRAPVAYIYAMNVIFTIVFLISTLLLLCTAPDRKPRRGEGEDLTHAALARVEVDE